MKRVWIAFIFLAASSFAKESIPVKHIQMAQISSGPVLDNLFTCHEAMLAGDQTAFSDDMICREDLIALPNSGRMSHLYEVADKHINVYSLEGQKFHLDEDNMTRVYRLTIGSKNLEISLNPNVVKEKKGFNCEEIDKKQGLTSLTKEQKSDPQTIEKVRSALEYSMDFNFVDPQVLSVWAETTVVGNLKKGVEDHLKDTMCKCEKAGVVTPAIKSKMLKLLRNPPDDLKLTEEEKARLEQYSKTIFNCTNKIARF